MRVLATLAFVLVVLLPSIGWADALDEHYARGNEAAARADWETAIEAYEAARSLLPHHNAPLSYNLGTAYAEQGDLGRATLHLLQAMDVRSDPSSEVVEAARYNLGVVRRRIELQSATDGTRVDRPEDWWDLVVEALRAPGVGWLAMASGWAFLLVLIVHRRRRLRFATSGVTSAALVVLAIFYLSAGVFYAAALSADRTEPRAVIVEPKVDAREGAGTHRKVEFSLQAGSRVRIVDRTPGWAHVELPGGLRGWVPEQAVEPI